MRLLVALAMALPLAVPAAPGSPAGTVFEHSQLLRGDNAAGEIGDMRLANDRATFVFSAPGHRLYRGTNGGGLIDLALNEVGIDRLGELHTAHGPGLIRRLESTSVTPGDDGESVVIEAEDTQDPRITVRTEYRLDTEWDGLIITSEVTNGTDETLEDWALGDQIHAGSTQLFLMDVGMVFHRGMNFQSRCAVVYGDEFSMALTPGDGAEAKVHVQSTVTRLTYAEGDVPPGGTLTATRRLFVGTESMHTLADAIWSANGVATGTLRGQVVEEQTGQGIGGAEVLVNLRGDAEGGSEPLLRVISDEEGEFLVNVPSGIRVIGFPRAYGRTRPTQVLLPAIVEESQEAFQQYILSQPALIDLRVTDDDTGELLPVRVAIYTRSGQPADLGPLHSGEAGGPYIFADTGEGQFQVPVGQFRMTITHGPEYERYEHDVIFFAGMARQFHLSLNRIIDSSGYVAADFGALTSHSHDALVSTTDRVRTAVCAGLDFLVSTDTERVTDLGAALDEAGLEYPITVAHGERILARGGGAISGHTVFPIPSEWVGRSAFAADTFETPSALYETVRGRFPNALITCLAPSLPGESQFVSRGYTYNRLTHEFAAEAPTAAAEADFDVMEVFGSRNLHRVREDLDLTYTLMREGHRFAMTGSANSRFAGLEEIGHPRTYVAADDSDPGALDPQEIFDSLRAGNTVVSNGPLVEFSLMGHSPGTMFAWEQGEPVEFSLRIRSPRWIHLAYADVCKSGQFVQRHNFLRVPQGPIYDWEPRPERRLLMVRGDEMINIEVGGGRPIQPMNPNNDLGPSYTAFAVTTPIWIDTDGNGRYDRPEEGLD